MPLTQSVVDKQLAELTEFQKWTSKKEVQFLPEILNDGEVVKGVFHCTVGLGNWVVFITTRRLLMLNKGMLGGLKQNEIQYDKITMVGKKNNALGGTIVLTVSGAGMIIENIDKSVAPKIIQLISEQIQALANPKVVEAKSSDDLVSQLERLASLKEKGLLTEAEFDAQKKRLLQG